MAKEDYTKKKDESKYRMPIVRDSEKSPHYNMRMPDKSTIRKKATRNKENMSRKLKGLNPELEEAVGTLLKEVMADPAASLTDKTKSPRSGAKT
jgi:hypothetical protein